MWLPSPAPLPPICVWFLPITSSHPLFLWFPHRHLRAIIPARCMPDPFIFPLCISHDFLSAFGFFSFGSFSSSLPLSATKPKPSIPFDDASTESRFEIPCESPLQVVLQPKTYHYFPTFSVGGPLRLCLTEWSLLPWLFFSFPGGERSRMYRNLPSRLRVPSRWPKFIGFNFPQKPTCKSFRRRNGLG